jgi:hypothetical protein
VNLRKLQFLKVPIKKKKCIKLKSGDRAGQGTTSLVRLQRFGNNLSKYCPTTIEWASSLSCYKNIL